jgi:hypothetical protein
MVQERIIPLESVCIEKNELVASKFVSVFRPSKNEKLSGTKAPEKPSKGLATLKLPVRFMLGV